MPVFAHRQQQQQGDHHHDQQQQQPSASSNIQMNGGPSSSVSSSPSVPISQPRPIHTVRELRSDPDETEPTFSYERESYMMDSQEMLAEDEFHRRMGNRLHNANAGGGGGNSSSNGGGGRQRHAPAVPVVPTTHNQKQQQKQKGLPGPLRPKIGGGKLGGVMSSFWRTTSREGNERSSSAAAVRVPSNTVLNGDAGGSGSSQQRRQQTLSSTSSSSSSLPHPGIVSRTKSTPTSRHNPNQQQQQQQQQNYHHPHHPQHLHLQTTQSITSSNMSRTSSASSNTTNPTANYSQSRGTSAASATNFASMSRVQNERKVSGGLLGAALQLQSQSTPSNIGGQNGMMAHPRSQSTREVTRYNNNNNNNGGVGQTRMPPQSLSAPVLPSTSPPMSNNNNSDRFRRSGSTFSASSSSSGPTIGVPATTPQQMRIQKKDVTRQRQLARRQKMEALSGSDMVMLEEDSVLSGGNNNTNNNSQRSSSSSRPRLVSDPMVVDPSNSDFRSVSVLPSPSVTAAPPSHLSSPEHGANTILPTGSTATKVVAAYKTNNTPSIGTAAGNRVLFGKSSSLLFPTGVGPTPGNAPNGTPIAASSSSVASIASGTNVSAKSTPVTNLPAIPAASAEAISKKQRKLNILIDQCESSRFSFNKKKLILENMDLLDSDIPVKDLYHTNLGNSLHKLSLARNRSLATIPPKLVTCLPLLKTLDISQCNLYTLPSKWHLPQLKRLNLSNNQLREFPEESILEGLLELNELNLYKNKISEIIVPPKHSKSLQKLEKLNISFNDLEYLPDELEQLKSLRVLKIGSNLISIIPMRVCDMLNLKSIDVAGNPVTMPPMESCEHGICTMRRFYQCVRVEEQSKQKALEAVQNKAGRVKKTSSISSKKSNSVVGSMFSKPMRKMSRKTSEESHLQMQRQRSTSSRSDESATSAHRRQQLQIQQQQQQMAYDDSMRRNTSVGTAYSTTSTKSSMSKMKPILQQQQSQLAPPPQMQQQYQQQQSIAQHGISSTHLPPPPPPQSMTPPPPAPVGTPGTPASLTATSVGSSSFSRTAPSTTNQVVASPTLPTAVVKEQPPQYESVASPVTLVEESNSITVNDTLKVIFVGMAMAGKTSMIRRLIQGEDADVPDEDNRTIGVDIYQWDPKDDHRFEHIDSRIVMEDDATAKEEEDVNVKLSVWDFAGQHVYHATHELFFSKRALYVLVWDMGAMNPETVREKSVKRIDDGAFKLTYDSSDDEDEECQEFISVEEERRANRALERDIDEKVQFWVDCIQSSAPGSAILPVASFDDKFSTAEAQRRCNFLKDRLLKHEERRIQGIQKRLKEYEDQNRANEAGAMRLRKLMCSYSRPKLIFGTNDDDSVVRVSGKMYTGFATLTERIVHIATGRDKANMRFPIFRGHVGARIPRMRLQVRDAVRNMRNRFKVVEWGYFINNLKDLGLTSVEDISDALHFLTNIGELSFFGGVMPDSNKRMIGAPPLKDECKLTYKSMHDSEADMAAMSDDDDEEGFDDNDAFISMDDTSLTMTAMTSSDEGSLSTSGDAHQGLSQFIFLNPRWLVSAVACILRHDLDQEIRETRHLLNQEANNALEHAAFNRGLSFNDANLNCPIITSEDACMLWQAKKFTKKAAQRAEEYSNNMTMRPFQFLEVLLTKFGVFVPIDLGIEKAFLGGKEYARQIGVGDEIVVNQTSDTLESGKFFFLPSLLGPGEASEAWTYKSSDSWKGTLCHTVLFPDGVPPGLMERITASVLNAIHGVSRLKRKVQFEALDGSQFDPTDGKISVKEILCWRTAFFLKLGMEVKSDDGVLRESIVEVFAGLVDRNSPLCVGSDAMRVGSRRLVISGKGQIGDGGRKIWKGGYIWACKAVQQVMEQYGGLEYEKEVFCPECLAQKAVSAASCWNLAAMKAAVKNSDAHMMCKFGHRVDTRLLAGPIDALHPKRTREVPDSSSSFPASTPDSAVAVNAMLPAVVVVGLWDGKSRKIVRVGSGFMADKKRGLIVTAAHTLMNIWGDKNTPFGEDYYGLSQGKVVVGVIPRASEGDPVATEAVFRYFAKIVAKDPSIAKGVCHLDACVLQITTRMENDVRGVGDGCGDQIERLLLNNPYALKQEKLQQLKITEKCELDEQVRIIGYNQGGEGLLVPGEVLNRDVDFAHGYVCKKFSGIEGGQNHVFRPRQEIVVICRTIGGHSGGPCVNQQGEVIGILSRADPAETQRCYLVPAHEWKGLLKRAKKGVQ